MILADHFQATFMATILTSSGAARLLSIIYLILLIIGLVLIYFLKTLVYTPQSKFIISFDAGSYRTKGILYEVKLEKSDYGIIPITALTKCEIQQGIHESIIPLESKEDEWNVHWPLNVDEENRNENEDDNSIMNKEIDLHKIMPLKSFDEIDTKPSIPNEKNNKSTIDELAYQLGDCYEMMLKNLTQIHLQDPKRLSLNVTSFLFATAGMRMLQIEDKLQNSLRSQLIFMHIRNEFQRRLSMVSKHWPTIFDSIHTRIGVISSKEEAIGAWLANSYLLRRFYVDSHFFKPGLFDEFSSLNLFDKGTSLGTTIETALIQKNVIELVRKTAVIYLGSQSFRITFAISGTEQYLNQTIMKHKANIDELRIMDVKYQVYGNSLMCFGLDRIWDRSLFYYINKRPDQQTHIHYCLNSDIIFNKTIESLTSQLCLRKNNETYSSKDFKFETYQFKGDFNSEKCYELIHNLIDYDECSKHNFMFCAFNEMLSPLRNLTFIATSKLYDLTRIFGKSIANVPYSQYVNGMNNWCKNELRSVLNLEVRKIIIYKEGLKYCFALHYVEQMFINVFQITKEDFVHINFIEKLDKEEIDWSLGYLIGNLDLKAKSNIHLFLI